MLAAFLLSFSAGTTALCQVSGPEGNYYDLLRSGVDAFEFRGKVGEAAGDAVAAVATEFRDALLANGVDQRIAELQASMRLTLEARPDWGILLEVRRYENPQTQQAYIYTGGPLVVGLAPNPAEAAAAYLLLPGLHPPVPAGTWRSPSSYMIWVASDENGELKFNRIDDEMRVWQLGDDLLLREDITGVIAKHRDNVLSAAADHIEYARAAETARRRTQDANLLKSVDDLEKARVAAEMDWAKSLKAYEDAAERAERDSWSSGFWSAMEGISAGLAAAEKAGAFPRTKIDGVALQDDQIIADEAERSRKVANRSLTNAQNLRKVTEDYRVTLIKAGDEIRAFYIQHRLVDEELPDRIPVTPNRGMP